MKMSMTRMLIPAFCVAAAFAFAEGGDAPKPEAADCKDKAAVEKRCDKAPDKQERRERKNFRRGDGMGGKPHRNIKPMEPRNLSIVIDCSAQSGHRFEMTRKFAVNTIKRMSTNEIVSVIVYDGNASVLVPAQAVVDKEAIISKIMALTPKGDAALFAAVSAGAAEVRKNLDKNLKNDILVFGSGVGNIGPSSDGELKTLSDSLGKEKIDLSFGGAPNFRRKDGPHKREGKDGKDFKKDRKNNEGRKMPPPRRRKDGKGRPEGDRDAPPPPPAKDAPPARQE